MLTHPIIDKLNALKCRGMARAFTEQLNAPDQHTLPFEERLGLLVDQEAELREQRRLTSRLRIAAFPQAACMEDIDTTRTRGLDSGLIAQLTTGRWIRAHEQCLIVGATGTGKSWVACALAHKACLLGFTARYYRFTRLWEALHWSRADGSYAKLMKRLTSAHLLILDDWGLSTPNHEQRGDLLEVLDQRYQKASTIVTSQLPIDQWHDSLGDATLADAIMDRLVHNAHRIELKGESMRRQHAPKVSTTNEKEASK